MTVVISKHHQGKQFRLLEIDRLVFKFFFKRRTVIMKTKLISLGIFIKAENHKIDEHNENNSAY